jgi:hypothetical protein
MLKGQITGIPGVQAVFCILLFLIAATGILQPVMAANDSLSIAYRGSGGSVIGETVIFDGRNTYGNVTLIKITGPGLPAGGLPANNLNGAPGSGFPVEVNSESTWKYVWYSSTVPGVEKLQTARYTFTATDSRNPDNTAATSVMLKKPEFYITPSPNPSNPGNYVQLIGSAEQGITFAKIDVADATGRIVHTFTSPVSSSGYLSYGFHVDMDPGQYYITVSNPSLKTPYRTVMQVTAEENSTEIPPAVTLAPEFPPSPPVSATTGIPPSSALPAKSPMMPVTIVAALAICGIFILAMPRK